MRKHLIWADKLTHSLLKGHLLSLGSDPAREAIGTRGRRWVGSVRSGAGDRHLCSLISGEIGHIQKNQPALRTHFLFGAFLWKEPPPTLSNTEAEVVSLSLDAWPNSSLYLGIFFGYNNAYDYFMCTGCSDYTESLNYWLHKILRGAGKGQFYHRNPHTSINLNHWYTDFNNLMDNRARPSYGHHFLMFSGNLPVPFCR